MVKQGGQSWPTMQPFKRGVGSRLKCTFCGRHYKMEWALKNHEGECNNGKEAKV